MHEVVIRWEEGEHATQKVEQAAVQPAVGSASALAQVPFGHFWTACAVVLFFFSSSADLRGRDYTTSSYRIHARRRQLSETEPNRELRGRLAELKYSLCSGLKAWVSTGRDI